MNDGRGEGRLSGRSMPAPPHSPLAPPMHPPPAASTVLSPPLSINYLYLPKSPPSLSHSSSSALASASVLVSVSASSSNICVCIPYLDFAVPLVDLMDLILILFPPCNYCHCPYPFSSLVMGSVTCVHFVPEASERLVQQKQIWLEIPHPSDN